MDYKDQDTQQQLVTVAKIQGSQKQNLSTLCSFGKEPLFQAFGH